MRHYQCAVAIIEEADRFPSQAKAFFRAKAAVHENGGHAVKRFRREVEVEPFFSGRNHMVAAPSARKNS